MSIEMGDGRAVILSKTAEYALRIAAFLALHADTQEPFRGKEVAEAANIPQHYAAKVLRKLVSAGVLEATRGHGGGFILARPTSKTRFLDILEAIEGPTTAKECVFGLNACNDKKPCPLHFRWKELSQSFHQWASDTTLADIEKDVKRNR